MTAVFSDPGTEEQMSASFGDAILSEGSRKALFSALENRDLVWVKMKVKDLEGELQPIEIMNVEPSGGEISSGT